MVAVSSMVVQLLFFRAIRTNQIIIEIFDYEKLYFSKDHECDENNLNV